ncbi:MAG: hypothetical protein IJL37_02490 [Bacteroidaceae bacterium]|nr:hypothetical protein [Bacteroidaceae bacterium]
MTKRKLIVFGTLFLMAMGVLLYACADKELEIEPAGTATTRAVEETVASKYYRILPGTSEWKSLETGADMWDASQLPDDMLRDLSTEELVEACMEFPMAYDYGAFADERIAISDMINRFNGLTELARREDAGSYMIDAYRDINYTGKPFETYYNNTSVALSMAYIELLLMDDAFLKKMSKEELKTLEQVAEDKYMHKLEHPEYFGLMNIKQSLMVCAELAMANDKSYNDEERNRLIGYTRFYQYFPPEELTPISLLIFR